MREIFVALFCGFLFGVGLLLSGMTLPQKVIGFLDVFGAWDPTLVFVMVGAIGVNGLAYVFIRRRQGPVVASTFHLPPKRPVDGKLLCGAALFGVGWALAGYCPGPALVSLQGDVTVFVIFMAAGIWVHNRLFPI